MEVVMREIPLSSLFTIEELDDIWEYCYQMICDGSKPALEGIFFKKIQSYLEQYHRNNKEIIKENLTLERIAHEITSHVRTYPKNFSPL
jgi:hypothetical protein